MAVSVSRKAKPIAIDAAISSSRPYEGATLQGIASAMNNLAGWRFRRTVSAMRDHAHDALGVPTIPASETFHAARWVTSHDAVYVFVAFTYYARNDWSPSGGQVSITLSLIDPPVGVVYDAGCTFNAEAGLLANWESGGTGADIFVDGGPGTGRGLFTEMSGVQRTGHTGFRVSPGAAALTSNPRPLNCTANTDTVLNFVTVDLLVSSIFVWEMFQAQM